MVFGLRERARGTYNVSVDYTGQTLCVCVCCVPAAGFFELLRRPIEPTQHCKQVADENTLIDEDGRRRDGSNTVIDERLNVILYQRP